MLADAADEVFHQWRGAMLAAMATPDDVLAWQDRRYRFAHEIGLHLTMAAGPGVPAVTDHVVYGVCVTGGGLIYVGQTADAKRRLRDLPVGESHHLATTVPAETWDRVLVVQWPDLLARISASEARTIAQLGHETCGLAIEHLLQITYRPILTTRRRSTAGGWTARRIDASRSRGALASTQLPDLFRAVQDTWDALSSITPHPGQTTAYTQAGRAVFPAALITQQMSRDPMPSHESKYDRGRASEHRQDLDSAH